MTRLALPVALVLVAGCSFNTSPPELAPDAGPVGRGDRPRPALTIGSAAIQASVPPPPLSGGTLLASADGERVFASDPDADAVHLVDLAGARSRPVALQAGDEPGRLALDGAGRLHVVLRGGGALATIDPETATVLARRAVCAAPRGLAFDAAEDAMVVACASGELVWLPAASGAPTRVLKLDGDLRDVMLVDGHVRVTRLRSAELAEVTRDGVLAWRTWPETLSRDPSGAGETQPFSPMVAWRTISMADGSMAMVHERGADRVASVGPSRSDGEPSYGGSGQGSFSNCNSIVESSVSIFSPEGSLRWSAPALAGMTMALDVAVSRHGDLAVVAPGGLGSGQQQWKVVPASDTEATTREGCFFGEHGGNVPGQALAAAWTSDGLAVQTREPAGVYVVDRGTFIAFGTASRRDTGHDLFHLPTASGIACASCHPEGGEDGHTWTFPDVGARRTQTTRGGILGTEPFHWSGDVPDLAHVMQATFTARMSGGEPSARQIELLGAWLDTLDADVVTQEPAASLERGRALFEGAGRCADCHVGARTTNNLTMDVGTGGSFQVPPLRGVAARAPYLHDGRAATLEDAIAQHGTVQLDATQRAELRAYLRSL